MLLTYYHAKAIELACRGFHVSNNQLPSLSVECRPFRPPSPPMVPKLELSLWPWPVSHFQSFQCVIVLSVFPVIGLGVAGSLL